MLAIRSAPKHAPSLVSLRKQTQVNMCTVLKKVISNKDFVLLMVAFSMLDGTFIGFGSTLSLIFEP